MLGEAYAIVHNSGNWKIDILMIMAVLLLLFARGIKGTAFLFSNIKNISLLKIGFICMLFVCIGYLNMNTIEVKEKLANEIFSSQQGKVLCVVSGKISDIQQGENAYKVYITCSELKTDDGSVKYKGRIKTCAYLKDITGLKLGQSLLIEGQAGMSELPANPGQFDARKYYKNKGIYFLIYNGKVVQKSNDYQYLANMLYKLRNKAEQVIDEIFPESDGGLVKAMILGERADIDKNTKRLYQRNGIAHILAISGLHIALLGMGLFRKLKKYIGSYLISGTIAACVIILYGMITGLAVSTTRAIIMLVTDIVGKALGRSSDMRTSLGLSCIILCITNPYIIKDVGFLLSFGAIYAIATVFPVLKSIIGKKADNRIISALLASLSVNIITIPVIVYFYYEFPLYGILINIVVVPLVSVVLFSSVFSILTGILFVPLAKWLAIPVRLILEIYDVLCRVFEKLPYANINTGHIGIGVVIFYYMTVGVMIGGMVLLRKYITQKDECGCESEYKTRSWRHNSRSRINECGCGSEYNTQRDECGNKKNCIRLIKIVILEIGACAALIIGILVYFKDCFRIVFLDVGQGDGILISTEAGINILIDGGSSSVDNVGEYRLMPAIKYYGMSRLHYVFVTHGDEDHISGIRYLIDTEHTGITIENLVVAEYGDRAALDELTALAEKNNINVIYVEAGDIFSEGTVVDEAESGVETADEAGVDEETVDEAGVDEETVDEVGVCIKCLYPSKTSKGPDANDLSLVLKLETKNLSAVFTGDIGASAEEELLAMNTDLSCDILKIAHHGSKYSSCDGFLSACNPDYAIISCGRDNRYGHPHKETLERLESAGSRVFGTPEYGAITVEVDESIRIRGFLQGNNN